MSFKGDIHGPADVAPRCVAQYRNMVATTKVPAYALSESLAARPWGMAHWHPIRAQNGNSQGEASLGEEVHEWDDLKVSAD